jgi:hypothetical protein
MRCRSNWRRADRARGKEAFALEDAGRAVRCREGLLPELSELYANEVALAIPFNVGFAFAGFGLA